MLTCKVGVISWKATVHGGISEIEAAPPVAVGHGKSVGGVAYDEARP
jgi:hypothetical protein